eukprot:7410798-Alexandrium_andersonii.AAC.1
MRWSVAPNGLDEFRHLCWCRLGSGHNQVGAGHLFCNCPRLRAHSRGLSPELRKITLQGRPKGHVRQGCE